jgi:7-carboxy-7-deazaguanine synthase
MARLLKVSRQPDSCPEIFYSVQGEGVNTGKPAIFLRLALCNLACVWCDTRYTWDWKQYNADEQIKEMSLEEVEREILRYSCRYLVVTGGEPMLQQKQLVLLLERLNTKDFYVEIETNGTILPINGLADLVNHWSISPKLKNSGNLLSLREIPEAYGFFGMLSNSHFKYVIENKDDFTELQGIISKYNLDKEKIILMPEARNREMLLRKSRWLVELCKEQGYMFSTRLQILLWGNKRAV